MAVLALDRRRRFTPPARWALLGAVTPPGAFDFDVLLGRQRGPSSRDNGDGFDLDLPLRPAS